MNSVIVRLNTPNQARKVSSDGRFGPRANSRTSRSRYALVRPPIRATAASSPTHESRAPTVRVTGPARGATAGHHVRSSNDHSEQSRHSPHWMTDPTYGARLVPDWVDKR